MRKKIVCYFLVFLFAVAASALAQSDYTVIPVTDGGTISGTVKWTGPAPKHLDFSVTKDPQICDPDGKKSVSLDRLIIGPDNGVANTIVYLKNISAGKALDLPEQERHLDQTPLSLHSAYSPGAPERRPADAEFRRHAAHHPHGWRRHL